jgi:hypothetical protein
MAKYLSYSGLEKVWGLAKNYFPTVKTATSNGADVSWTTNTGVISGNIATFSVDAEGLVKLQGITPDSLTAHTHSLSIATDSGTSQLDMSANTTYKLTAGGSTFIFKTPAHQAHQTLGLIVGSSATATSESGTRGNDTTFVNLLGGGALKDSVQFTGAGSVSVSGANGKVTITGSHQDWGLVAAGSSGTSNASVTDPYINLVKGSTPTLDSGVQLKGSNNVTVSSASGAITISGLANTVTGSSLTANEIILGNGSSTVKASGKTIEASLTNDANKIPTSAAVYSAISGLSGAMHFIGTTTTALTDGATTATLAGSGLNKTTGFVAGDVVIYDSKEFVWTGSAWEILGDEGSYALKSYTVSAGAELTGGGRLDASPTISHDTSGVTSGTYGPTAAVSGANSIAVPKITVNQYGHITAIETFNYTGSTVGSGKLQVVANSATTGIDTSFTANSESNTIGLNFINGTHTTAVVTAVSGKAPTITFNHNSAGSGTVTTTTNGTASDASAGTSYDVLTGVTVTRDSLGHVTGVSTTRQKVVSNQTVNNGTMQISANSGTAVATLFTANGSTANAIKFVNGTGNTVAVTAASGTTPATVTVTNDHAKTSPTAVTAYPAGTSDTASADGGTIKVRDVQINANGHITSSQERTITLSQVKNTTGSSAAAASTKYYITGAASQDATGVQTYSSNKVYFKDNILYSNDVAVMVSSDMEAITDAEINSVCIL